MNTPVSFELAQLLKENGFCSKVRSMYCVERLHIDMNTKGNFNDVNWVRTWRSSPDDDTLSAPTIAEVVMWLFEKHGVWISVKKDWDDEVCFGFESMIDNNEGFVDCGTFNSPIEAYEAAISYWCKSKNNTDK